MSSIQIQPYIFFTGQCAEAMEFYRNVFGGVLEVVKYDDLPAGSAGVDGMEGKIMNATLTSGDIVIRASDSASASEMSKKVELCIVGSDEERLRKIFDGLSEGGGVKYPLKKEFWGDIFGTLTDRYGIDWMVNITS